jgi:hypothetical protein
MKGRGKLADVYQFSDSFYEWMEVWDPDSPDVDNPAIAKPGVEHTEESEDV